MNVMNAFQSVPAPAALAYLKQGYVMRLSHAAVMAAWKEPDVALSGRGWTVRLTPADFLDAFGHETFVFMEEREGLDEERDRQYYKWRSEKQ